MGLVFASRRTHIDVEMVEAFLTDDEWNEVPAEADIQVGDMVLYKLNGKLAHVGLVSSRNEDGVIMVLSKWGDAGEYFHEIRDVPRLCGVPAAFYTDRKVI